ncbi:ABC transporter permease [Chloroflexia bacterium SDU3-3]|nr:ABC transporter permease [Chloroflexia bacterium SDU3-3]
MAHARRRHSHPPDMLAGAGLLALVVALTLGAPMLGLADPAEQHLLDAFGGPSAAHPLGTDHLGRDMLARLAYGGRATLATAAATMVATLALATMAGLAAGYLGGWADALLMRLCDLLMAIPGFILAVAVAGTLGGGLASVVLALAITGWTRYARVIRAGVQVARRQEYIQAARALGFAPPRILLRHILPNIAGPLVVLTAVDCGQIILAIAGLNFLGLGTQPPSPEWGALLNDAQPYIQTDPQLVLWPAAALFGTALGCNLLGDGLRDMLDPQRRP